MTSNSIRAQEAQTKREELAENKRHNRASEGLKSREVRAKNFSTIGGVLGKVIGAHNDPSWYNADPQLVKDTASIPYGRPLGTPTSSNNYYGVSQPGVAALFFAPTIGVVRETQKSGSGVSVHPGNDSSLASTAAKALYAFVRHANSGSSNYDAPDLFQYVLSIDSLLMVHGTLCKIYSLLKDARASDRYFPSGFLKTMGLNEEFQQSLLSNLANLRAYINVLGAKINAFYYPSQLTYFTRHYWMCTNIFKDQNLKRSQHYHFVPDFIFKYNEINGQLVPVRWLRKIKDLFTNAPTQPIVWPNTVGNALESIKVVVNPLIDLLLSSESIGIMSGDILKAFNSAALIGLKDIDENYHIEPTYSQEVLTQIDSATMAGLIHPEFPNNDTGITNDFVSVAGIDRLVNSWTVWQDRNGQIFQSLPPTNPTAQTGDTMVGPYVWSLDESIQQYLHNQWKDTTGYDNLDKLDIRFRSGGDYVSISDSVINQYKDDVTPDDTMVASRLSSIWSAEPRYSRAPESPNHHYQGILKTLASAGSEVLLYAKTARFNQGSSEPDRLEIRNVYDSISMSQFTNLGILDTYPKFDWAPKIRTYDIKNFRIGDNTGGQPQWVDVDLYDVAMTGNFANYATVDGVALNGMHTTAIMSQLGVPYFRGMVAAKRSR